jgi:outer membrane protein assembly factor BamE (lipoprotein component of BamABCDE complex)
MKKEFIMSRHLLQLCTFVLIISVSLTACTKRVDTHGNVVKQTQLDRIQIGTHNQRDIASILGSPSATGTFNQNRWYYITEKAAVHSLGDQEILERDIIIFDFNDKGIVTAMSFKNKAHSNNIIPSTDTTETHGQTMGVVDQLIDNLSRGL